MNQWYGAMRGNCASRYRVPHSINVQLRSYPDAPLFSTIDKIVSMNISDELIRAGHQVRIDRIKSFVHNLLRPSGTDDHLCLISKGYLGSTPKGRNHMLS